MAKQRTFVGLCEEAGWCCAHGCLAVEDAKAARTPDRHLTPTFFVRKFDFSIESGVRFLAKWRNGLYRCENKPSCMLVKAGIKTEDLPSLSESRIKFLALKGTRYNVYKVARGTPESPMLQRLPDPTPGVIVSHSQIEWLWVTVCMEKADTTILLGDLLYLDNALYGTVIEIDGPNVIVLLPGSFHGQRNRTTPISPGPRAGYVRTDPTGK